MRERVWQRLATRSQAAAAQEMTRTIPFDELPKVFDDFIKAPRCAAGVVVDMAAG